MIWKSYRNLQSTVTQSYGVNSLIQWKHNRKIIFGVACLHAKNTIIQSMGIHTFFEHSHLPRMNSFKNSRKMGLTSFYHNFNTFFRSMLRTEIRRFMNTCNGFHNHFGCGTMEKLSVFCVWTALMSLAFIVFLFEVLLLVLV